MGSLLCVAYIYCLVCQIGIFVRKYQRRRQRYYHLREFDAKCNKKSSRYIKIEWLSKQYLHKFKMIMNRVLTEEHHQFNV
jgi:hypothetical protein